MTPTEALEAELVAEARALARRLGAGQMLDAIVIRVELDRETGMRKRRIIDRTGSTRAKRCESAA